MIDEAICSYRQFDISDYQKLDEEPYDFVRKRLSILVSKGNAHLMITKGALRNVLDACSTAENSSGAIVDIAGASLFLPFLPLLPKQILLTNLLTDFPEMTIATDNVDKELVEKPRRWNISFIRNFMMTFGLLSSVFDYLTFGVLFFILHASPEEFRAGWFLESVISASLVVLVVRTRMPFFKSIPGKYLLTATLLVVSVTLVLPFISVGRKLFGFTALPLSFLVLMGIIVAL